MATLEVVFIEDPRRARAEIAPSLFFDVDLNWTPMSPPEPFKLTPKLLRDVARLMTEYADRLEVNAVRSERARPSPA